MGDPRAESSKDNGVAGLRRVWEHPVTGGPALAYAVVVRALDLYGGRTRKGAAMKRIALVVIHLFVCSALSRLAYWHARHAAAQPISPGIVDRHDDADRHWQAQGMDISAEDRSAAGDAPPGALHQSNSKISESAKQEVSDPTEVRRKLGLPNSSCLRGCHRVPGPAGEEYSGIAA